MILNRKEKERLVIKLANEGKNTREIAKQAHVSLRDIGHILGKYTGDIKQEHEEILTKKPSLESMAFKMFQEGKSNVDIAISLNLPAQEVLSLHQDFHLSNLDKFSSIYRELSNDLRFFIELYYRLKEERLKLVDFYQSALGRVIYSRRRISVEPLIKPITSIFRIDPAPARGYDKVCTVVLFSVLLYQILVYYNCKIRMKGNPKSMIKYMLGC